MAKELSKKDIERLAPSLVSAGQLKKKEIKKIFDKAGYNKKDMKPKGKKGVFKTAWRAIKKHFGRNVKAPKKILREVKKGLGKATGDAKGKATAERRAVNIREEYGDLLKDPTLWDTWSRSKRHKFSKDVARADKYGASPFKTLSGLKGHELRQKVRAISQAAGYRKKAYEDAKEKHDYYKRHPNRAKKDGYNIVEHEAELAGMQPGGNLGHLNQIPKYTPEQQKVLSKLSKLTEKHKDFFTDTKLGKSLTTALQRDLDKGPPEEYKRKEPALEKIKAGETAREHPVSFKPAQVGSYREHYEDVLSRGLEAAKKGKIREFNEEILPEISSRFHNARGGGAEALAVGKASDTLKEALARIEGEYAEKAIEYDLARKGVDINRITTGINKGTAQTSYLKNIGLGGYEAETARLGTRYTGQGMDQQAYQAKQQYYENAKKAALDRGDSETAQHISQIQATLSASPYENLYIQPQSPNYFGANTNVQSSYQQPNYLEPLLQAGGQYFGGEWGRQAGHAVAEGVKNAFS